MIEYSLEYENLINNILSNKFHIIENFLQPEEIEELRLDLLSKYLNNNFKKSGIGKNGVENPNIRKDFIYWIEKKQDNNPLNTFYSKIDILINYLNYTCYTGIKDYEFHYALYTIGAYYKKHFDQFHIDNKRKISVILYLNPSWEEKDGGELVLYKENKEIKILPIAGRLVCFKSDELEHEVKTTNKERLSIAGWLKN